MHIYVSKEFGRVIEDLSFRFGFWLFPHFCISSSNTSCSCNHNHELGATDKGPPHEELHMGPSALEKGGQKGN